MYCRARCDSVQNKTECIGRPPNAMEAKKNPEFCGSVFGLFCLPLGIKTSALAPRPAHTGTGGADGGMIIKRPTVLAAASVWWCALARFIINEQYAHENGIHHIHMYVVYVNDMQYVCINLYVNCMLYM